MIAHSTMTARMRAMVTAVVLGFGLAALPVGGMLLAPGHAHAVIGRPFTPMSYAGVARRSSRRVARRTMYRAGAYSTTLPAGCAMTGVYYSCGGVQYQEAYDGGNVVYIQVEDDD